MPYDRRRSSHQNARRSPAPRALALALAALGVGTALAGCGSGQDPRAGQAPGKGGDAPRQETAAPSDPPTAAPPSSAQPSSAPPSARTLAGRTVVIDPGHNPGNFRHSSEINQKVNIGTGRKECDTTGTSTNDGYTEASFTLDVSHRLRDLLTARGATVVLTHDADRPWGPCIDERARIGNEARADAVVSVHADGSAVGNRGFHVILPARVRGGAADTGPIVAPSRDLGERIAAAFGAATGMPPANYLGGGTGLDVRDDLGGLNLSTAPKVFVECGNMRDPKDAGLLASTAWRQKAARGLADGIETYLKG
ncbi:N-acetylmuramoyl-L-alanine amidase [Streptomyces sp. NPDC003327]